MRVSYLAATALAILTSGCTTISQVPTTKGQSLTVVRAFLEQGHFELPHFGAYSYVLIPQAVNSDARYGALLEAYVSTPVAPPEGTREQTLGRLNITYAPVVDKPPTSATAQKQWILENYDVTRAAIILGIQGLRGAGPYIITAKDPLSLEESRVALSVLDLSDAPKESMSLWFKLFVRQSQEPDWRLETAAYMALKLHDLLGTMYEGTQLTVESIEPAGKILKVIGVSK